MPDALVSNIAHLSRRAGFGARPDEIQALTALGYQGAVARLLDRSVPDVAADAVPVPSMVSQYQEAETVEERKARNQLRRVERRALVNWWLARMTATQQPLREKLTWFWHGHFATSIDKVQVARLMYDQNVVLRTQGAGSFEALTQAVAKDGAMMVWLDSNSNAKGRPNENFARELMELFTIGIGSYTDADVREAARSFTGWKFNKTAGFRVNAAQADSGPKNLLGATVVTGEQVVTLLSRHPAAARFVASRVWSNFAYPVRPDDPVVSDLAPLFAADGDVTNLLRAVFLHPQFISAQARQGLVKQPVEYVVGALRALNIQASAMELARPNLETTLEALNQEPFAPPSVGGWPQNGYWISTATSLARLNFAQGLAGIASLGWLSGAPAAARPDLLAQQLGVDGWTATTLAAIKGASTPKLQLTAALVSPEYVLN